jgi:D-tyrosyl-tRNA(Tyr) deacylase
MIAVVQRVLEARVDVAGETVGTFGPVLLVLASIVHDDAPADAEWFAQKLVGLRIFRNGDKHFDLDVTQAGGSILLVSNFTVAAATRKGRRPSLDGAARPEPGEQLFNHLVECVRSLGVPVGTGKFGADMQVHLINDGPSTFIVQTDPKIQITNRPE